MAEPGQALSARYVLGRRLGAGGMATVFQGSDRVLDRTVAVKVLAHPFDADPAFVDRFRREARAAASLGHPNVVAVFDTGSDGPVHYIVMEYVDGATLADVLRYEGSLPPDRAVKIGLAICSALEAAHGRGLVHRDVKPGNVMVTSAGDVKVTDFGIARATAADSLTHSGVVLGTAAYLSPEQARGEQADARSDLYAVGCVLYEILTGRPPFVGEAPVAVAYQHVSAEPVPPSEINPAVPAWLDAVVMRALSKDPGARFQSAAEMGDALEAAARGGEVLAPAATAALATAPLDRPTPRTAEPPAVAAGPLPTRSARRRKGGWPRWAVVLLGAVLLAAVAAAIVISLSGGQGLPSRTPRQSTSGGSPTPTPPTVAQAYASLVGVITAGENSRMVAGPAGDALLHTAEDILHAYQDGHADDALKKVDAMQKKIGEFAGKGQIGSDAEAASIQWAVAAFAGAMKRQG